MLRRLLGYTVVFAAAIACSRDDTASAHPRDERSAADRVPARPAVISPLGQPYREVAVVSPGIIAGTVDFDGAIPGDTMIRPTVDVGVCGNTLIEKRIARSGSRVGGVLVWLTDIRSGKALPLERRFELTNSRCTLDPYIQPIYAGSTLNVGTEDRAIHTNRFINVGTGEVKAIAPFNDDGEVVPLDRTFTEPAQIEVVCQEHPWTRAWIAVLDHPYFAKTSNTGTFTIDAVPAGRYRIRAWHPSLGVADDSVSVVAGQQVSLAIRMRAPRGATPVSSPPRATPPPSPTPVPVPADTLPDTVGISLPVPRPL